MKRARVLAVVVGAGAVVAAGVARYDDPVTDAADPGGVGRPGTLVVRVEDARGAAVPGADVVVMPTVRNGFNDGVRVVASPTADGTYVAEVTAGDWTVRVGTPRGSRDVAVHVDPGQRVTATAAVP